MLKTKSKFFAETHFYLLNFFDFSKNIGINLEDYSSKNNTVKFWWKCPIDETHVWCSTLYKVSSRKFTCSLCPKNFNENNSLAIKHPEIARQWHPSLNILTPYEVYSSSDIKIWWECPVNKKHVWEASIENRTMQKHGCHYCSGTKTHITNCLNVTHPELSKEWHPTLNELTPNDILSGSSKKYWWKCLFNENHIWKSSAYSRTVDKSTCHFCSGTGGTIYKVCNSNSLNTLRPDISKEWHPTLNEDLNPNNYTIGSGKIIWWQCPKYSEHIWKSSIKKRVQNKKRGCLFCGNILTDKYNNLPNMFPEIFEEWDNAKNILDPETLYGYSSKKVFWKCKKQGHSWTTKVVCRTKENTKCPKCRFSKGEFKVKETLEQFNFRYDKEHSFENCKLKQKLRFDFIVYKDNKYGVIEYNGEQHYTPVGFGGNADMLYKKVKLSDKIKKNYCLKNNIPFLEIPYLEYNNIENMVLDFMAKI